MRSKIYEELVNIRKELQALRSSMELGKFLVKEKKKKSWWDNPEITTQYANNEIAQVELRICLSGRDWSEIQEKPFYRELIQYLDSLKIPGSTQNQCENPD